MEGEFPPAQPISLPASGTVEVGRSGEADVILVSYLPRPSLAAMRWSKSVSLFFFVPLSRFGGRSLHCLQC